MPKPRSNAQTAVGPIVIAAVEQYLPPAERIVTDPLALHMLPRSSARIVALCRWPILRRALIALSEAAAPGAWGGMLGRKRFLQDEVEAFVQATKGPVVVLGAGLDTKAAAVVEATGTQAFEIDQADNVALKQEGLRRAYGTIPDGLHLIPIDFEHDDLSVALARAGFDVSSPAFYLWEGVTQYLSEDAVHRTMSFLSKAAPGSRLGFTYVLADFLAGKDMHGAAAMHKRLVEGHRVWTFGLEPDEVPGFLADFGWNVRAHVGAEDHRRNYFSPSGRSLPIMAIERAVIAEKG